jgi:uridine kinase
MEKLLSTIDALLARQDRVTISIDGPCTAGKTTLAAKLAERYDCNVFHMDDFFLRPEQRTPERYAEPGGNVDYERFQNEVLTPVISGTAFQYQPFDCKTFTLSDPVFIKPKKLTIIEGSYCNHPHFGKPYDLKIFLTIPPELQRQRIMERPAFLHRRFLEEWIPMEQHYFDHFQIEQHCDLTL